MRDIDLIPPRRREARARRRRTLVWLGACVVYGSLAAGGYAIAAAQADDDRHSLDEETARVAVAAATARATAARLEADLAAAELNLAAGRAVAGQPDWSVLLALLAAQCGHEVVLRRCQLGPVEARTASSEAAAQRQRFVLRLAGIARSQLAVSRFVLRLESIGLFDKVVLMETSRETFMDAEAAGFRVECALSGSGGSR